ncbi:LON peptidase substrate-binding domain-containing protein [Meridianimarinicoccus sp. RP-17]|uniref:LON peptidase substrate-binding domain-containing protein n=1 Tax=Meridianimarinicoccus zhengii TaxID=2056810 RepID=UPI000DAE20F3|nr:LON peptidase substrate-binding domain-containing protein [Phycocomes zhengii]
MTDKATTTDPAAAPVPIPEDGLIVLPVCDFVPFLDIVFLLAVGRAPPHAAVEEVVRQDRLIGIVLQRDPAEKRAELDGLFRIGCSAEVMLRYMRAPDSDGQLICRGTGRFRLIDLLRNSPFPIGRVISIAAPPDRRPETETRFLYLRRLVLSNDLLEGRYEVDGHPVALGDIRVPIFVVATERDHVAPWWSVQKITLFDELDVTFLLTSGGHNAGIVSEPGHAGRRYHLTYRPAGGVATPIPRAGMRSRPSPRDRVAGPGLMARCVFGRSHTGAPDRGAQEGLSGARARSRLSTRKSS